MDTNEQIAAHYSAEDALKRIDAHLRENGVDPEHPTLTDLAPYDNFHGRGFGATLDQIALAAFPAGARVLDVGGGLGGPARALAQTSNVHVTVLDLTPTFVDHGRILTERLGMTDQVDFVLGDGTDMPFDDASFDGVWTQHSTMNIHDKESLYAEIYRVLVPGGRMVLHEVMAGNGEPVDHPMPWAGTEELSDLRGAGEMRALIAEAGFRELAWIDESDTVMAFLGRPQETSASQQPPGQMILWGPVFVERIRNYGSNIQSGKIVVIRALFERIPGESR